MNGIVFGYVKDGAFGPSYDVGPFLVEGVDLFDIAKKFKDHLGETWNEDGDGDWFVVATKILVWGVGLYQHGYANEKDEETGRYPETWTPTTLPWIA